MRSDSRYTRKNSLKGKVIGITDATALAALKESGMDAKVGSSGTTTIFPPALRRSPPGTATPW